MKLPSRSDLVKPDRFVLTVAAVSTAVTLLVVLLVLALTDPQRARMDRFGATAARAFAELAVEPLMRQDRLHLGVIGNRFAEAPEIRAVATHASNDELLTSTGEVTEPTYTHPVTLDQAVVGYVRVALDPEAFAEPVGARVLGLAFALLLVPVLVASGWTLTRAARSGELARRLARPKSARVTGEPAETDAAAEPAAPPAVAHYLLAVNLYNQLSLQPSERDFERRLALELAETVARECRGQVQCLPGVGVLLDFDHSEDPERPFQVICAALLLARLLRDEAPFGNYRLGLNLALHPAGMLPVDDPAVSDATLLSALAPDDTLAISATVAQALENETRYAAKRLDNPLLDELATSNGRCYLVIGVAPPFDALLGRQAERIKGQRDATSSPSTF